MQWTLFLLGALALGACSSSSEDDVAVYFDAMVRSGEGRADSGAPPPDVDMSVAGGGGEAGGGEAGGGEAGG
ncbi:hypothetical protein KKB55_22105, partial [Myxococcota bacterium]|nr:hypothetical protein [Myxococcota bacterium]